MAPRTPDARAKGLLSWLILAVAVVIAAFTVGILVVALEAGSLREVTGTLAAGAVAVLIAIVAFVDQRRKVRATRTEELAAASARPHAGTGTGTEKDDPVSR